MNMYHILALEIRSSQKKNQKKKSGTKRNLKGDMQHVRNRMREVRVSSHINVGEMDE